MTPIVVYFSASGITAKLAATLAAATSAQIHEIIPAVPYTKADLDWMDKSSRSSVEMSDPSSRPAIADNQPSLAPYDTIFIGFPIWWYIAPTIINTFLEACDLSGKTIIPFATSGSSGMGKTNDNLKPSCPGANLLEGKVWPSDTTAEVLADWVKAVLAE